MDRLREANAIAGPIDTPAIRSIELNVCTDSEPLEAAPFVPRSVPSISLPYQPLDAGDVILIVAGLAASSPILLVVLGIIEWAIRGI